MRNNFTPVSQKFKSISANGPQGNRLAYFVAGSLGLFLMSTQLTHVVTARLLQSYESRVEAQQSESPTYAASPHSEAHKTLPNTHAPTTREAEVSPKRSQSHFQQSESSASCEKPVGRIANSLADLDAQTGRKLASYVESHYKVSAPIAKQIVSATFSLSRKNGMDPFLALGIIASESSFNHKARSGYGATGLMQVYGPVHKNVLEDLGIRSKNPKLVQKMLTEQVHLNVAAGIRIYKTYEKQYGSPTKALQAYNGAKSDASFAYANKVLAMRDQLRRVSSTSNACA
ncbi:transglycosylase SLT domain-containing protein [Noviherbaspirillum pedocola]|uniref:Lytic transglycosylase domain-containing protein n=1 Tax=Noviherbaspirillum pedocola TaxID=2801341 RepID=A0A934W9N2_9BURK|nr:lytic transglycosylase domain-containing protein [Noviherbaspirillum pedocola]MBK4737319.1 lytic transglycosylase domain-containing protein [Noviherbaspirillum pedocola]